MNISVRSIINRISILIMCICMFASSYGESVYALDIEPPKDLQVDLLFTHDIHSYIGPYKDCIDGKVQEIGGIPRISSYLQSRRVDNPDILLVDGGDLSVGTLYQTLYEQEAAELCLLGELGYDATTFGNHDFDFEYTALANMFDNASSKSDYLPALCISNLDWSTDNDATRTIYEAASKCNLCDYIVIKKGDVKIAIFGIFGKEAATDSPTLEINVIDQIEAARDTVAEIKANEDVDMIVCLSHSGTTEEIKESEDEQLAMQVPDIDVIVSSHSHTVLNEPIVHGDTYIVSCGCYGKYVGSAHFTKKGDSRWSISDYELVLMTEDIVEDSVIKNRLKEYDAYIDEGYLSEYNLKTEEVIAYSDYDFESIDDMYFDYKEHRLGNLMSDAYKKAVDGAQISIVPSGTVRGTFYKGDITVADAFENYSLGTGLDGKTGYPLVKFYLTGKEIKLMTEIDATVSKIFSSAVLYFSGISYSVGSKRLPLNRAYDVVHNPYIMDDTALELNDEEMYCIVTDMYSASMFGAVTDMSYGLLDIKPKYENGDLIQTIDGIYDWNSVVVRDNNGKEIKAWLAIATYLASFGTNENSQSIIPAYYNELHGRKIINDRFSIGNFFHETNQFFWMIVGVTVLFIGLIVFIILIINKLIKSIIKDSRVS